MTTRHVIAIFSLLPISALALDLPIYQTVLPGQSLSIDFEFDSVPSTPEGPTNILLANGGALSNGVKGSMVSLFHDGVLIGTWLNPMSNTFAIFKTADSAYTNWGATTDLSAVFNGGTSRIEFTPLFDPSVSGAFINYQLDIFGATTSIGSTQLSETTITPALLSESVLPIPAAISLFCSGIAGLSIVRFFTKTLLKPR